MRKCTSFAIKVSVLTYLTIISTTFTTVCGQSGLGDEWGCDRSWLLGEIKEYMEREDFGHALTWWWTYGLDKVINPYNVWYNIRRMENLCTSEEVIFLRILCGNQERILLDVFSPKLKMARNLINLGYVILALNDRHLPRQKNLEFCDRIPHLPMPELPLDYLKLDKMIGKVFSTPEEDDQPVITIKFSGWIKNGLTMVDKMKKKDEETSALTTTLSSLETTVARLDKTVTRLDKTVTRLDKTVTRLVAAFFDAGISIPAILKVSSGDILGKILKTRNGKDYHSFLGIPYGHAERFEVAVDVQPWDGVREAREFGSDCAQYDLTKNAIVGAEDCLFLNVYSPKLKEQAALPVIVWIHGGGYSYGSGSLYSAKYFMDEEVVLVTVNYRLSVFGFLDTQDGTVVGNLGLRDQRLALQWVRRNIHRFGGDPAKVTLCGASAGGASVAMHMLSETEGLFHRAISQSSVALSSWVLQRHPKENADRLAYLANCPIGNSQEMVSCLKKKSTTDLINAVSQFEVGSPISKVHFVFTPSVENSTLTNVLLEDCPLNLLQKSQFKSPGVPWIVGFTSEDGIFNIGPFLENDDIIPEILQNWTQIAPWLLVYHDDVDQVKLDQVSDKIRQAFLPSLSQIESGDVDSQHFWKNLSIIIADRWGVTGTIQSVNLWKKRGNVYPYIFSYPGKFSFVNHFWNLKKRHGVGHLDELPYLFNRLYGAPEYPNDTEIGQFSQEFVKLWVSFAKDGVPRGNKLTKWDAVDQSGPMNFIEIDGNWSPKTVNVEEDFKSRLEFWNRIDLKDCRPADIDTNSREEL